MSTAPSAYPGVPPLLKLLSNAQRWQVVAALAKSDHRVGELISMLDEPANLVSYHLRQLRGQDLVRERRSSADARDVYYSLELGRLQTLLAQASDQLHPVLGGADGAKSGLIDNRLPAGLRVLFLCTHNSARSQLAEGLLRSMSGGKIDVQSAGTEPSSVHALAIEIARLEGIDLAGNRSKHLEEFIGQDFDYVITVCDRASESCPIFPGDPQRIHWSIPDPTAVEGTKAQRLKAFRDVLMELRTRLGYLLILIARSGEQQARSSSSASEGDTVGEYPSDIPST